MDIYRTGQSLPVSASLLRLEGAAVLTSLRQVGGALELRLFNPLEEPVTAKLDTAGWPEGAQRPRYVGRVDMESNPLEEPWAMEAQTSLTLRPKEIVTLRFQIGPV